MAAAMIELADSAFQGELLDAACEMGLIRSGYAIPEECRNNTYRSLQEKFGDITESYPYPLGPGFDLQKFATKEERALFGLIGGN
jgi:hypothetical protein